MNIGKAVAIFNDIHNEEIEVEDKINAIDEVSGMATHNGITKKKDGGGLALADRGIHLGGDTNVQE